MRLASQLVWNGTNHLDPTTTTTLGNVYAVFSRVLSAVMNVLL